MNREELTKFILKYGDELLEQQGVKTTLDLTALEERLSKINGIGSKRLQEIMTVIENFLDEYFSSKRVSQQHSLCFI